jgi:hypothetical protein
LPVVLETNHPIIHGKPRGVYLSDQPSELDMATVGTAKVRCLWYADDGRCACCKARRIRNDVFHMKDYEMCEPARDYPVCDFYKEKPVIPKR